MKRINELNKVSMLKRGIPREFILVMLLSLAMVFIPTNANANITSYNVDSGDEWTYEILVAKRTFAYSFGFFDAEIITRGYTLGGENLPVGSLLNLSVIAVDDEDPVSIVYQLHSNSSTLNIVSNESQVILGLQNALGLSFMGNETNFFDNTTGISAGEEFFVVPSTLSWLSLFNVWNQSVPDLDGAIDGIETVLYLNHEETKKSFFMELEYSGTLNDDSTGIVLDFVYAAEFKWEKSNGILLYYDINSDMEGTVNNSNAATFSLDIRIEREEELDYINNAEFFTIFLAVSAVLSLRKRKK
ncbi:MAG: hypothetical protein ACXAAM_02550 [Candidatus Heimdallarchaeaceae archaeon]